MKANEKAVELLDKMNGKPITLTEWEKASDYAKSDLKRKCLIVVSECIQTLIDYGTENDELQNMDNDFRWWDKVRIEIENL